MFRVLLSCAFGSDLTKVSLQYENNGVTTMEPVQKILAESFHRCMIRKLDLQIILFPDSHWIHYKADDRENLRNIRRLREFMNELVENRKKEAKQDNYVEKGDLLSTLLSMEFFKENNKLILDECFTFFFAGS